MRVVACFPNKTERGVVRQALTGFKQVDVPISLPELLDEIRKPASLEFLIVSECPDGDETISVLDAVASRTSGASPCVVCMIMNEGPDDVRSERQLLYSQMGADFFLNRPYGVNDFKQKIEEARGWIENPPAQVQALRKLRALVKAGNYQEAEPGLQKFYALDKSNLAVAMLLAEVYMRLGGPKLDEAITLLKDLEQRYPKGLQSKKLLFDAYRAKGQTGLALATARNLWLVQESQANCERVMGLMNELKDSAEKKNALLDFLATIQSKASLKNQETRLELLETFIASIDELRDVQDFLEAYDSNPELGLRLKDSMKSLLNLVSSLETQRGSEKWLYDLVWVKVLRKIVDLEPGEEDAIEPLIDALILEKDFDTAYKYISTARDAKKVSANYYAAAIRLALAEGRLREASDALQAARRLKPADDRWPQLSARWSEVQENQSKEKEAASPKTPSPENSETE